MIDEHSKAFIADTAGFMQRYLFNRGFYQSCKEAYEHTEEQYRQIIGRNRYASYDSFRSAYTQFYRRHRPR